MSVRKLPVVLQNPSQDTQETKCNKCNKPLSVPPIRLIGEDFVCGRCPGDGLRMKPMEAFAKQLRHRCCNYNDGCRILLTFGNATQHENNCDYEKVQCVIMKEYCEWTGPRNKSKAHVESEHRIRLMDGKKKNSFSLGIVIGATIDAPRRFLLTLDDDIFKISIASFEGFTSYKVRKILPKSDSIKYSYRVTFSNGQNMLMYLRQCSFKLEIRHDFLKTVFGNLTDIQADIAANTTDKLSIYEKVLPKVECPVCLDSLRNRIYTGICGHSVCSNCSPKIQKCPICQQITTFNIRNYTLENLRNSTF